MSDGAFVWHDLATTDVASARAFYENVVGWTTDEVPGMDYVMLHAGGTNAGGMMALPSHLQAAGVPPHWTGYIQVADVDGMATRVTEQGGAVKHGPADIPGVGRFAAVSDPDGAMFYLFAPSGDGERPGMMAPGHVGWNELATRDHTAAFGFYAGLFGWHASRAIDMGPMGTYQLFGYQEADRGGMMNAPPGVRPHWLFYFVVNGIDAACTRIGTAGGTVLGEPMEVPGGAWVVRAQDPQGAHFALVSVGR